MSHKHLIFCTAVLLSACSNTPAHFTSNSKKSIASTQVTMEAHPDELSGVKMAVFAGAQDKALAPIWGTLAVNKQGCLIIQKNEGGNVLPIFPRDEAWLASPPKWSSDKRPLLIYIRRKQIYSLGDKVTWYGGGMDLRQAADFIKDSAGIFDCGVNDIFIM